jgi:hypothetical protein
MEQAIRLTGCAAWAPTGIAHVVPAGFDLRMWRLGLANPVHLDDDHAFTADVGQVDEHQRASPDGA